MKQKMTSIDLKLCDIQGRLFQLSIRQGINSAEFIKVFMKSDTAKALDSTYNRMHPPLPVQARQAVFSARRQACSAR